MEDLAVATTDVASAGATFTTTVSEPVPAQVRPVNRLPRQVIIDADDVVVVERAVLIGDAFSAISPRQRANRLLGALQTGQDATLFSVAPSGLLPPRTALVGIDPFGARMVGVNSPLADDIFLDLNISTSIARVSNTFNFLTQPAYQTFAEATEAQTIPVAIEENWTRLALSGLSDEFFRRLFRLARKQRGWRGEGSEPLNPSSLTGFLELWKLIKDRAVEPEITLAPNGHLCAEWHKSWRKHFDIEFKSEMRAYYGLIDHQSVHEGCASIAELVSLLTNRSDKPTCWRS